MGDNLPDAPARTCRHHGVAVTPAHDRIDALSDR
jgi:hypothetical protein